MPEYVSCRNCPTLIRARDSRTGLCRKCYEQIACPGVSVTQTVPPIAPEDQIQADRQKMKGVAEIVALRQKYDQALKTIDQQDAELKVFQKFREGLDTTYQIEPREGSGTSEATPVILASDWHAEETVTEAQTNGLNVYNLEIADARIQRFFQASVNLMKNHLNPGVHISDVVLALLGDFITNDIHEELVENVSLKPTEAIIWVQNRMVAGLDFLLNHTPYTYTIVCRVGNHSRTTHKTHFSQENGHSLEHLLYVYLAAYYRGEPRLKFVIQDGYHIYLDVYDKTLRFHHGHAIKYGGGIGGLFIPTYKAISQWSKARHADLDCFGHFHQTKDGGNFKANGSGIGYNSFGVQIKGDYEPPRQTLFLVDKRRGVTCDWPILLESPK